MPFATLQAKSSNPNDISEPPRATNVTDTTNQSIARCSFVTEDVVSSTPLSIEADSTLSTEVLTSGLVVSNGDLCGDICNDEAASDHSDQQSLVAAARSKELSLVSEVSEVNTVFPSCLHQARDNNTGFNADACVGCASNHLPSFEPDDSDKPISLEPDKRVGFEPDKPTNFEPENSMLRANCESSCNLESSQCDASVCDAVALPLEDVCSAVQPGAAEVRSDVQDM